MKLKFKGLVVLLLALTTQISFAQKRTVSEVVKDFANLPTPGVSALIKKTRNGTQTDFDGNHTFKVTADQTSAFNFIETKHRQTN